MAAHPRTVTEGSPSLRVLLLGQVGGGQGSAGGAQERAPRVLGGTWICNVTASPASPPTFRIPEVAK
ncbi:hypothetical protein Y1Q_0016861 [Alligator mississippiensis]|uniref:Uncharacterized protein n=1 Tax=Alligator mississippiensis TaxID=8496 RepID=A0A151P6R4_ALLMI|nr:hypothetical protein Y1Q_0016861 [Alligator mississippiensis]